jgi:hypothetical protein
MSIIKLEVIGLRMVIIMRGVSEYFKREEE